MGVFQKMTRAYYLFFQLTKFIFLLNTHMTFVFYNSYFSLFLTAFELWYLFSSLHTENQMPLVMLTMHFLLLEWIFSHRWRYLVSLVSLSLITSSDENSLFILQMTGKCTLDFIALSLPITCIKVYKQTNGISRSINKVLTTCISSEKVGHAMFSSTLGQRFDWYSLTISLTIIHKMKNNTYSDITTFGCILYNHMNY